jgi:hypothetical protein
MLPKSHDDDDDENSEEEESQISNSSSEEEDEEKDAGNYSKTYGSRSRWISRSEREEIEKKDRKDTAEEFEEYEIDREEEEIAHERDRRFPYRNRLDRDDPRLVWESDLSEGRGDRKYRLPISDARRGKLNCCDREKYCCYGEEDYERDHADDELEGDGLVRTGTITEDYTGRVFETFREVDPLPEREEHEPFEDLCRDNPRLRFLTGDMEIERGTRKREIEYREFPEWGEPRSDIVRALEYEKELEQANVRARRDVFFARNGERAPNTMGASGHDVLRGIERPYGFYGFQQWDRPHQVPMKTQRARDEDHLNRYDEGYLWQNTAPTLTQYGGSNSHNLKKRVGKGDRIRNYQREKPIERTADSTGKSQNNVSLSTEKHLPKSGRPRNLRSRHPAGERKMPAGDFDKAISFAEDPNNRKKIRDPIRRDPLANDISLGKKHNVVDSLYHSETSRKPRASKNNIINPQRSREFPLSSRAVFRPDQPEPLNYALFERVSKRVSASNRERGLSEKDRAQYRISDRVSIGDFPVKETLDHAGKNTWLSLALKQAGKNKSRHGVYRQEEEEGFRKYGGNSRPNNLADKGDNTEIWRNSKRDALANPRGSRPHQGMGALNPVLVGEGAASNARNVRDALGTDRRERRVFEPRRTLKEGVVEYKTATSVLQVPTTLPMKSTEQMRLTSRRAARGENPRNARSATVYYDLEGYDPDRGDNQYNRKLVPINAEQRFEYAILGSREINGTKTGTENLGRESMRDRLETTRNTDFDLSQRENGPQSVSGGSFNGSFGRVVDPDHRARTDRNVRLSELQDQRERRWNISSDQHTISNHGDGEKVKSEKFKQKLRESLNDDCPNSSSNSVNKDRDALTRSADYMFLGS